MNFGIQLEHACGGVCACTTCHVHREKGTRTCPAEEDELDRLDMAAGLSSTSRLGCQAVVKGDVTVEIPAWNRNYVSEGGGSMNLGDAIPPQRPPLLQRLNKPRPILRRDPRVLRDIRPRRAACAGSGRNTRGCLLRIETST